MITKNVGGSKAKSQSAKRAAAKGRTGITVRYSAQDKNLLDVSDKKLLPALLTNCSDPDPEQIIKEMEAWSTLNKNITDPVSHVVFSLEKGDRKLTRDEWQKVVDIYSKARGLGDAPYAAWLHDDGHKDRNSFHLHLTFIRIQSDGKAVSDSWDSKINRAASRAIERELGLNVNAGAADESMYNGRNRHSNRDRAGERQGFTEAQIHVDPNAVQSAISASHNIKTLRENLAAAGIQMQCRHRDGGVYAWSLRNVDGPKEWTSGSKITPDGSFGWAKVQGQLDGNTPADHEFKGKRFGPRMRGGINAPTPKPKQRIDQATQEGMTEAIGIMTDLMSTLTRKRPPRPVVRRPTPAAQPVQRPTIDRPKT